MEIAVSFGLRAWVVAGLLCASVAARAEYKEVWNPPEAAAHAKHAQPKAKPVRPAKSATNVKAAGKTKAAKTTHAVVKPKPAVHISTQKAAPKTAQKVAAQKTPHAPSTVVSSQAPPAKNGRELPPILK
jgi:hypothetical protein